MGYGAIGNAYLMATAWRARMSHRWRWPIVARSDADMVAAAVAVLAKRLRFLGRRMAVPDSLNWREPRAMPECIRRGTSAV